MDLHAKYPGLYDLKRRAQKRLPKFVWEYLDSATGVEATKARNRAKLDKILLKTSILLGDFTPDLSTKIGQETFPLPFGIAPVGMSGLIWPDAERILAQSAARSGVPYCLSTVAAQTPEYITPYLGGPSWFQLYPPKDPDIRQDMLNRAKAAGFDTLVLTVDIPVPSRRERQTRSGLTQPPKLTPRLMAQVAMRPAWALATAREGMPRMRTLDKYISPDQAHLPPTAHIGYLLRASPDWDYLRWLREHWKGQLIVKGVTLPEDATKREAEGIDVIWISNHAGPVDSRMAAVLLVQSAIRAATSLPIIFDSGIEGGLDILRAIALGANFVMLGRAFHYAVAALGEIGPDHLTDMLKKDIQANMGQIGTKSLKELASCLI